MAGLLSSPQDRAGAVLSIDLAALTENWRILKRRCAAKDTGAVVKADGYGTGAVQAAAALKSAGCATFYVAHLDEGIAVRGAVGAGPRVVVMHGPNRGTERDFAALKLIPVLNTPEQIAGWRKYAETADILSESLVHVDTGMNRLGLTRKEFDAHIADGGFNGLHPLALMSHLACSEEAKHPLNEAQRKAFAEVLSIFRTRFPDAKASFTNSSGIFLDPAYHYDYARPGVALYGVNPTPDVPNPMLPVVRLFAKIIQVRRVDRATTVGYGATAAVPEGTKLATVSIGYADGIPRSWGAGGAGFVDGIRCPVKGRVSMDLVIFDVSNVPDSGLHPGALMEIIGSHSTVDDVATAAGTIGYEILTSLGARYHRHYLPAPTPIKKP
ncbi:MAG: alanine racemase [Rhodospirillaceae bacterium]|nr:alanine racemase [Rhodospirillaceae bacterium]